MYQKNTEKCLTANCYKLFSLIQCAVQEKSPNGRTKKIIMRANITIFILFAIFMQVSAAGFAQKITINQRNVPLRAVLTNIGKQSGFDLIFDENLIKPSTTISINIQAFSLEEALDQCLEGTSLTFKIADKIVVITRAEQVAKNFQQKISGKVTGEDNSPLPGASVKVLGKSGIKLTADGDGLFSLNTVPGDSALQVSYIGYKTVTQKIVPGKTNYLFKLTASDSKLKDVVVTGMFDKPKESFTGAVTVITKEQIKMFGNRNLLKTISNIEPAFNIQERNNFGSNPNSLPDIDIRGNSSIGGVMDLQSNVRNTLNLPLFILDGFEVTLERVMDMNQSDVESVVILKDASSTSMYGSRGANGVMVITSIKPAPGKLKISYTGGVNLEIPDLDSYNLMNSTEKLAAEQKAGLYTSTSLITQNSLKDLYNEHAKAIAEGVNTNWLKVPTQTGIGQYHRMDMTGGDNQFRYILNGSYNQIKGAMKGSERNNFNGSMTISYLLKKVRFSNNLSVGINKGAESPYGQFSLYVGMNPYWRAYGDDGKPTLSYTTFGNYLQYNPAYNGDLSGFQTTKYTSIRNTTNIDWDILKVLKLNASIGVNKQVGGSDYFVSPSNTTYIETGTSLLNRGSYTKKNLENNGYQIATTLSYGQLIGKHNIYAGLNAQALEKSSNSSSVSVRGFLTDTQTDISNGIAYVGEKPTTIEATNRNIGFTGTLNYSYDGRYFVDGTYRLDGGSSFGSLKRFAPFWSAGIGWTLSNEKMIKDNLAFVNNLRLRYSIGETGSLVSNVYQALTTYTYDRTNTYRNLIGASITAFGNESLQAQTTLDQNLGLDLSLFNSTFSLVGNVYRKKTSNLITSASLPYSHGFDSYTENLGTILNKGYDIQATLQLMRNRGAKRNIFWSIQAAVAHNTNVIVKLSDVIKKANELYSNQSTTGQLYYEYREGQSYNEVYGYISPGVDVATGNVLYLNADGSVSSRAVDKFPLGSTDPKIEGRLSTMFRYGGLSATIGFATRLGGKKFNNTLLTKVENAYLQTNVDRRVNELRWSKPGDISAYRSLNSTVTTQPNDRFIFTETTIQLNNINIAYDLPQKWVSKLKMQRIGVSATMSNILYMSNIELERGTAYPYAFQPSFTLNCTF